MGSILTPEQRTILDDIQNEIEFDSDKISFALENLRDENFIPTAPNYHTDYWSYKLVLWQEKYSADIQKLSQLSILFRQ
jgi:hypothetical protein